MAEGDAPPVVDLRKDLIAVLPRLRRFCFALTGNRDDADDLCQAAIERALSKASLFRAGTRLDSWMYRIAQNLNIDAARKRATRGHEVPVETAVGVIGEDGSRKAEIRSDIERVRAAMAKLPDEQRAVLACVALDGMSYKEAANALDIPMGTVMSRLARARVALDRALHGGQE